MVRALCVPARLSDRSGRVSDPAFPLPAPGAGCRGHRVGSEGGERHAPLATPPKARLSGGHRGGALVLGIFPSQQELRSDRSPRGRGAGETCRGQRVLLKVTW